MDWEKLNLHVENLIPGMVLTVEVAGIAGWLSSDRFSGTITKLGGVEGIFLVSMSYSVGVLLAVVSRLILDSTSERVARPWLFENFVHRGRNALHSSFDSDPDYGDDWKATESRTCCWPKGELQKWNCLYRAVLRMVRDRAPKKYHEVSRRRTQGRLVRNLFVPLLLSPWVVGGLAGCAIIVKTLCTIALIPAGLFLYAYAELNNMAEALDICFSAGLIKRQGPAASSPSAAGSSATP